MAYMRTRPPAVGLRGLGEYDKVPTWSWMYYPPPYTFADPLKLTPPPGFHASPESMGMGGCGCNGSCGDCGVGAVDPVTGGIATVALAGGAAFLGYLVWEYFEASKRSDSRRRMKRARF